jgi:SAM-dependent methyltransferase
VSDITPAAAFGHVPQIRTFFDRQYAAHERYWWRGENRYSVDPMVHTEFHATLLAVAARRGPGVALDLGAGEGADAIRLAKLGYQVDAVEVSAVACEHSHPGFAPHVHSHIKLIAARSTGRAGDQ